MGSILPAAFDILLAIQATQAAVTGVVRDARTGDPIEAAVITVATMPDTVKSGPDGRYALRTLPSGEFEITVSGFGYEDRTFDVTVPAEGEVQLDLALSPSPFLLPQVHARPVVTVRGSTGGASAIADRWIPIAAIRNHPMTSELDVFAALTGGTVTIRPESPAGLHVRGGASDQTAYLLDGIPILSPYHAAGIFSAWNVDALARLELHSTAPPPAMPDALSGVVAGVTRPPGGRFGGRGSVSTTQARATFDGPLGTAGAGWLFSLRSGYPGVMAPRGNPSYLTGGTGDWMAKLEVPLFGGQLRLLGHGSRNEIDAAATADIVDVSSDPVARNTFDWDGHSFGLSWLRADADGAVRLHAWSAAAGADVMWALAEGSADLATKRRDEGVSLTIERLSDRSRTVGGVRIEQSRTAYMVGFTDLEGPSYLQSSNTPVTTGFFEHGHSIGEFRFEGATAVSAAAGALRAGPRLRTRWSPTDALTFSASWSRTHQFAQSLRNAESVVGNVFPADLYLGANGTDVPVARSDLGVVAAELRPWRGVRLAVQAYDRSFDGLLLVAPGDGEPFSIGRFSTGSGSARGIATEAAISGSRLGLLVGWGWRRVRYSRNDTTWVPEHGAAHDIEAGVVAFPMPTLSLRLAGTAVLGRRTTPVPGALAFEACTLTNRGCEFGGSPHYGPALPGTAIIPGYVRLDAGVRKQWTFSAGSRDLDFTLFGTLSNLLGRENVLTWTVDPATGERTAVGMRPRSPLVIGLDWEF
jgi:hypothetical protein